MSLQEYLLGNGVLHPPGCRPENPPVGPAHPEQRREDEPTRPAAPGIRPRILGERYVLHEGGDGEVDPGIQMDVPAPI